MNIKDFNQLEAGQRVRNTLSGRESIVAAKRDGGGFWFVLADLDKSPSMDSAFKSEDPHQWEVVNEANTVQ